MQQAGRWAFIVGMIVAVVGGMGFGQPWFSWLLAVLGLIVGLLNVQGKEARNFLLAAIGLIVAASALQVIPYIGNLATRVIGNLVAFIAAAVLVVALKVLLVTAQD